MKTKIITDSGSNNFDSRMLGIDHVSVPLTIRVGDEVWTDDQNLNIKEFTDSLLHTKDKTSSSCPSIDDWMKAYAGADEIYVLTITSSLSGTYNSAVQAARLFMERHTDVKIHVFDTKSAGPEIRLLSKDLAKMVNDGLNFDQIVETMKYKIDQTDLLFILQRLDNLANNGRISPTIAKISHLLNINVLGTANDEGNFEMLGKVRGNKKIYSKIISTMMKQGYNGGEVIIDHASAPEKAEKLKELILEKYPNAEVSISTCGGLCSYYAENGGIMLGFEKY